ncbi:MAG: hypothetical protein AB1405_08255 [Bdellovibrionota bacterium]
MNRPMAAGGLSSHVEPPPLPPPSGGDFVPPPAPARAFAEEVPPPAPSAGPSRDVPPPPPAPPPAPASPPKPRAVDLDLLPWVVKKQLAIETDQEDLDFEIVLWIEGKSDRLVIEGHRNDFGRIYVQGPDTPEGNWKRYRRSEFSGTAVEDVFKTYQGHIASVLVRTGSTEFEFADLSDFLEWAKY